MSAFRKSGGFGGGNRPGGFRPGGRPPFNNDRGGFGDDRRGGTGERFSAVCADCGQTCDVPFRPNGKKPVYCKACFPKHHSDTRGNDRPSFERREAPRSFERRDSYAPPAPRAAGPDPRIDSLAREITMLGNKLDTLTKMLEKVVAPKAEKTEVAPVTAAKPEKKVAAKKVAKKAAKKSSKK
jgi:CxxC-x17-CxxC domain-containing protein